MTPLPSAQRLEYGDRRRAAVSLRHSPSALPVPAGETFTNIVVWDEVCPPGARYTPGAMSGLILILTLHGRAQVTIAGKSYQHQPGTLLTIAPHYEIEEQVEYDTHWNLLSFMLSGLWVDQLTDFLRRKERPVIVSATISAPRRRLFTEMAELALTQPPGWQWRFVGHGAELLGDLYAEAAADAPGDALLRRLSRRIDAEPEARFTVAELAEMVGLTPRQLLYQFQKAAGQPLAQWIRERRIDAARRLLGQGRSVTAVSDELGFANPYHFSRVFKAVTGVAPSTVSENALRAGLHLREGPF